jgi:hypothetical protein
MMWAIELDATDERNPIIATVGVLVLAVLVVEHVAAD